MRNSDIVIEMIKKCLLPLVFLVLYIIMGVQEGHLIGAWIICGFPFGITKTRTWFYASGTGPDLGSTAATIVLALALNIVLPGVIGGFVLVYKIIIALWYLPYGIYLLVTNNRRNTAE